MQQHEHLVRGVALTRANKSSSAERSPQVAHARGTDCCMQQRAQVVRRMKCVAVGARYVNRRTGRSARAAAEEEEDEAAVAAASAARVLAATAALRRTIASIGEVCAPLLVRDCGGFGCAKGVRTAGRTAGLTAAGGFVCNPPPSRQAEGQTHTHRSQSVTGRHEACTRFVCEGRNALLGGWPLVALRTHAFLGRCSTARRLRVDSQSFASAWPHLSSLLSLAEWRCFALGNQLFRLKVSKFAAHVALAQLGPRQDFFVF
jgi:hypothetical protein